VVCSSHSPFCWHYGPSRNAGAESESQNGQGHLGSPLPRLWLRTGLKLTHFTWDFLMVCLRLRDITEYSRDRSRLSQRHWRNVAASYPGMRVELSFIIFRIGLTMPSINIQMRDQYSESELRAPEAMATSWLWLTKTRGKPASRISILPWLWNSIVRSARATVWVELWTSLVSIPTISHPS
jgi:hypothetical protein